MVLPIGPVLPCLPVARYLPGVVEDQSGRGPGRPPVSIRRLVASVPAFEIAVTPRGMAAPSRSATNPASWRTWACRAALPASGSQAPPLENLAGPARGSPSTRANSAAPAAVMSLSPGSTRARTRLQPASRRASRALDTQPAVLLPVAGEHAVLEPDPPVDLPRAGRLSAMDQLSTTRRRPARAATQDLLYSRPPFVHWPTVTTLSRSRSAPWFP